MGRKQIINTRNRILSQNMRYSLDTRLTNLNNNMMIVGGSGSGKTFRFVKPNILQMSSSFIITDPKGDIAVDCAPFLERMGYEVKMLDLRDTEGYQHSTRFNPFIYVREPVDLLVLINNLILNTTKKNMAPTDPFWESAEGLGLQAFFYYAWDIGIEHPETHQMMHNVWAVMEMLRMAEVKYDPETGERLPSELDELMEKLEQEDPDNFAVIQYKKVFNGAEDTIRSILMTMNARLAPLQFKDLLDLLWEDEMDIDTIGTRKTAVFCIIPDDHKTLNFIVGLLYSQMFHEMYVEADKMYGGSLPVHVTFMLDEFLNIALPDGFPDLLSTMRSRNISSCIIVQDLARTRANFKDCWEAIVANCDTLVYLGNNEKETFKYLSELLGDKTIEKRSVGESYSVNDSSSRNYDILGRKLMLEGEIRKLDRDNCIICIRGFDPILDRKYNTLKHPLWKQMCGLKKGYSYDARLRRAEGMRQGIHVYQPSELDYMLADEQNRRKRHEDDRMVALQMGDEPPEKPASRIIDMDFVDFLAMDLEELRQGEPEGIAFDPELIERNRAQEKEKRNRGKKMEEKREDDRKRIQKMDMSEASLYLSLFRAGFSIEQIRIVLKIYKEGGMFSEKEILEKFSPEQTLEELEAFCQLFVGNYMDEETY